MKQPDKPIVIVGLGKTGLSCLQFLHQRQQLLAVTDSREQPPELIQCQQYFPDVPLHLGTINETLLNSAQQIIVSPGVSLQCPGLVKARQLGIPIIGDIELFAQYCTASIIAITGTNGKSTVTTLVAELLKEAGYDIKVGGNLGTPALDLLKGSKADYYILELSSFQLDCIYSLRPRVAALLNISPDHLDRHSSYSAYINSKHRIYHHCHTSVFNRDDRQTWTERGQKTIRFGLSEPSEDEFGICLDQALPQLAYGHHKLLPVNKLRLMGKHNWQNALAALAIVSACGVSLEKTLPALEQFKGLEHRCQWVAEINKVTWYNDSKGTNVGACQAAIQGLGEVMQGKIILIAGGQAKGASFETLQPAIKQYSRQVIVFGQDAQLIAQDLNQHTTIQFADNLSHAVQLAHKTAKPGDAVLFSPACASFDSFKNFSHRGTVYTQLVEELS